MDAPFNPAVRPLGAHPDNQRRVSPVGGRCGVVIVAVPASGVFERKRARPRRIACEWRRDMVAAKCSAGRRDHPGTPQNGPRPSRALLRLLSGRDLGCPTPQII